MFYRPLMPSLTGIQGRMMSTADQKNNRLVDLNKDPDLELFRIHSLIRFLGSSILILALLILFATTMTFPFPFVRQIWFGEIWSFYGLFNSVLFIWISREMKRLSLAAVFAGLGMIVFEQTMTWRGFLFLHNLGRPDQTSVLYVFFSFLISAILLAIFLYTFYGIAYHRTLRKKKHGPSLSQGRDAAFFRAIFCGLYAAALYFLRVIPHVPYSQAYASFRMISAVIAPAAFCSIGYEIDLMLREGKIRTASLLMILGYAGCGLLILWMAYALLPLEKVIQ